MGLFRPREQDAIPPESSSRARLRAKGWGGPERPEPEKASWGQRLTVWLAQQAWRYRRPLAPPATGLGLHLASGSGHLLAPGDWPLAGVTVGSVAAIAAARLDRPEERAYVAVVGSGAAAWTAAAWAIGPEPHLLGALAVGGTLAAGPWWIHMRVRSRVTVEGPTLWDLVQDHRPRAAAVRAAPLLWERWRRWLPAAQEFKRMQRDWQWAGEEPALRGTELVAAHFSDHVITLTLKLPPTRTWRAVEAAAESIETLFDTSRHGVVTVEPGVGSTRQCVARLIEASPLDEDQPWPGSASTESAAPVPVGRFEADLSQVEVDPLAGHLLVAGATGSGKGGVISNVVGTLAARPGWRLWGGDPARSELSPWRDVFERLERTPTAIKGMLRDAMREVEVREQLLEEHGLRNWEERLGRRIAIVVDELAQLDPDALGLAARLAQRCRKAGIWLVFATQRPSAKALQSRDQNGTELRSQFDYRIVLHVAEAGDTRVILGEGRSWWRAEQLPPRGWFLILGPGHERPRRARAYRLTDEVVSATNERHALARPRSDADPAVGEGSASRVVPLVADPLAPSTASAPPELHVVGGRREDPLDRLREALARAGEHGARANALTREIGLSDSQTYHYLGVLRELREVEVVGRARYRLVDRSRWSVNQEVTQ